MNVSFFVEFLEIQNSNDGVSRNLKYHLCPNWRHHLFSVYCNPLIFSRIVRIQGKSGCSCGGADKSRESSPKNNWLQTNQNSCQKYNSFTASSQKNIEIYLLRLCHKRGFTSRNENSAYESFKKIN